MSTQPQSQPHVAVLTAAQRTTIGRAVETIVAGDTILDLAEFLQVKPVPDRLYEAGFFHTVKLLDQVVAIVDQLTGNTGSASCADALGDGT